MKRLLIALSLILCGVIAVPALADHGHKGKRHKHRGHGPSVISIPNGFQPEGITTFGRDRFLVCSRATGAIYEGSLKTGRGEILVEGGTGRAATGIKVDRRGRLFVSGAGSGDIRVYDAGNGRELRSYTVPGALFINDVIVTRQGAYFTDSRRAVLYFIPFERRGGLGELRELALGGEWTQQPDVINANGIAATRDGRTLIMVKSNTGEAFAVDAVTAAATQDRRHRRRRRADQHRRHPARRPQALGRGEPRRGPGGHRRGHDGQAQPRPHQRAHRQRDPRRELRGPVDDRRLEARALTSSTPSSASPRRPPTRRTRW